MAKDSLYAMFETDKQAEQEVGIVLNYGSAGKIRVARAGGTNQRYIKALEERMRPYRINARNGKVELNVDDATASKLLVEVFADAVVLDWEGIRDRNGDLMEFNHENVVKLFTDLPELFSDVMEQASKLDNFLLESTESDAGN